MLDVSSRPFPSGLIVGHSLVRLGIPPTESIPAICQFSLASLSDNRRLPALLLARDAPQEAVMPPLLPMQLQVHGPIPVTMGAAPVLHRLVVGALVTVRPLATPKAPFTPDSPDGLGRQDRRPRKC